MTEQVDVEGARMDAARLSEVVARFRRQHAEGVFPGGQLVVRRRGRLVVDEAVGIARGFRETEDEPRTPFTTTQRSCLFSAGKPLVGIAIAVLEQARAIDVERPVAFYFPEFAAAGKADITVLDVLLHRSGLYLREIERDFRRFGEWDSIIARIAST
ncbi:MAG TPA: serine hydrolase domain-containing protein, partial [Polyangiaceae bacterium]|nr:serine hydrolase domain-containing protein [Polyangiaceae bacterium]